MQIVDWIPSVSTAAAFAVIAWLCRKWIGARLTNAIGFEFDRKLELLKADIRAGEEQLKADLRFKEAEIATLRSSSIAALSSRQIALDKRKLEAIEQLWGAVISLNKARAVAFNMSILNYEAISKRAVNEEKIREFLGIIGGSFDITKDLSSEEASKVRPFVTPLAWAIYIAILGIIAAGVMRWHISKSGIDVQDFSDQEALSKMLKAALPENTDYIEKNGTSNFQFFIEKLESKLLKEFQYMMDGADSSRAGLEQAAEILKYSNELTSKTKMSPPVPENIVQQKV